MAKSVIRRLGVLSVAKTQGTLYALLGLIVGAVVALLALFGAALGSSMGSDHELFLLSIAVAACFCGVFRCPAHLILSTQLVFTLAPPGL